MACYVVFKGRVPGVYEHWEDALSQVKGFSGNIYKNYATRSIEEAHWRRSNGIGTVGRVVILLLLAFLAVTAYVLYVMVL